MNLTSKGDPEDLVLLTLDQYCSDLPLWMTTEVYLGPEAMLYAAVITVLGYLLLNRLGPLAAKQMHEYKVKAVVKAEQKLEEPKAWIQKLTADEQKQKLTADEAMKQEKKKAEEETDRGVLHELWRFHRLPAETQKLVEGGLRETIQGLLYSVKGGVMPKIGKPPSKFVSMSLKASIHEGKLSFSKVQRKIVKSEAGVADKKVKISEETQQKGTDNDKVDETGEGNAPTTPTQLIASKGLEYLDSTTWVMVIMVLIIGQIVAAKEGWYRRNEAPLEMTVLVFFVCEVLLRLALFHLSTEGALAFFKDIFNIFDVVVVLVDVALLMVTVFVFRGGGGSSGASTARLARFAKVLGKTQKLKRFLYLLRGARAVKLRIGLTLIDKKNGMEVTLVNGKLEVTNVLAGGFAERCKVEKGWTILAIGDTPVDTLEEYEKAMAFDSIFTIDMAASGGDRIAHATNSDENNGQKGRLLRRKRKAERRRNGRPRDEEEGSAPAPGQDDDEPEPEPERWLYVQFHKTRGLGHNFDGPEAAAESDANGNKTKEEKQEPVDASLQHSRFSSRSSRRRTPSSERLEKVEDATDLSAKSCEPTPKVQESHSSKDHASILGRTGNFFRKVGKTLQELEYEEREFMRKLLHIRRSDEHEASPEWRIWARNFLSAPNADDVFNKSIPFGKEFIQKLAAPTSPLTLTAKSWHWVDLSLRKVKQFQGMPHIFVEEAHLIERPPQNGGDEALDKKKTKKTNSAKNRLKEWASPEWCDWYDHLVFDDRKAFLKAMKEKGETQTENENAADQEDHATLFLMQALCLIAIMIDYMIIQERPTGGVFCQWAYMTGIVMYKPFTVPMWSCLLLCNHYSFAEDLYGKSGKRDKYTGTPINAPFERNGLTIVLFMLISGFQMMWFALMLPAVLPLSVVFLPVVLLVAFVVPFVSTFITQKVLTAVEERWKLNFKDGKLEKVKLDGLELSKYHNDEKKNKEIVMCAVSQNGMALQYASDDLKADEDIVMAAVKTSGAALMHAAPDLVNNKAIQMLAVRQDGLALRTWVDAWLGCEYDDQIDPEMKPTTRKTLQVVERVKEKITAPDLDVVLAAVMEDGLALEYAHLLKDENDKLEGDENKSTKWTSENWKQVVTEAVMQNGNAVKWSREFRKDDEIVRTALAQTLTVVDCHLETSEAVIHCDQALIAKMGKHLTKEHMKKYRKHHSYNDDESKEKQKEETPTQTRAKEGLEYLDSTTWVMVIMVLVIGQIVSANEDWYTANEGPIEMTVLTFFVCEVLLRMVLFHFSPERDGVLAFFRDKFNVLDFVVVLIDVGLLLLMTIVFKSSGSSGASSARLARFGKVLGKLSKFKKFIHLAAKTFRCASKVSTGKEMYDFDEDVAEDLKKRQKELFTRKRITATIVANYGDTINEELFNRAIHDDIKIGHARFKEVDKDRSRTIQVIELSAYIGNLMKHSADMKKIEKYLEELDNNAEKEREKKLEKQAQLPAPDEEKAADDPLVFDESLFVLKASATQLVSISILAFSLLPFYANGFGWWGEGARGFLRLGTYNGFDIASPSFLLGFTGNFSWPHFKQPKLEIQMIIGSFLVVLQLLFKFLKYVLRAHHRRIRLPSIEPLKWEQRALSAFSWTSWKLFGSAMDACKAAFDTTLEEARAQVCESDTKFEAAFLMVSFFFGTITFVLPLYYGFAKSKQKTFAPDCGNDDVKDFCFSEESMSYRKIEFLSTEDVFRFTNQRITKVSLYYISHKCTWIQELKLDYCTHGDLGELKTLGNLLQLRLLSCKSCKGLSGDLEDLSRLTQLEDLDLSSSGVTGDIGTLISVIRLKHLDLSRTLVDGNVWKLSGLRLEKLLLEGTQVSPQHLRNYRIANPLLLKAEKEEAQGSSDAEEQHVFEGGMRDHAGVDGTRI